MTYYSCPLVTFVHCIFETKRCAGSETNKIINPVTLVSIWSETDVTITYFCGLSVIQDMEN